MEDRLEVEGKKLLDKQFELEEEISQLRGDAAISQEDLKQSKKVSFG